MEFIDRDKNIKFLKELIDDSHKLTAQETLNELGDILGKSHRETQYKSDWWIIHSDQNLFQINAFDSQVEFLLEDMKNIPKY